MKITLNFTPAKGLGHCEIFGEVYTLKEVRKNHSTRKQQTAKHQQLVGEKIVTILKEKGGCVIGYPE